MAAPCQTLYLNNLPGRLSRDKLRRQLFNLCTKFGSVLDIVVHPGQNMRGQAWVVFSNIETASKAMSRLQEYPFFDKPIKAHYALENADVVSKLEGKFVPRERKVITEEERAVKKSRIAASKGGAETSTTSGGGHDANNPPGPILKIDNIPENHEKDALVEIFSKFDGYLDVRYVPAKQLAFVEYKTMEHAKVAREGLKGFQITPTSKLRVNYAKPRE